MDYLIGFDIMFHITSFNLIKLRQNESWKSIAVDDRHESFDNGTLKEYYYQISNT